VLPTSVLFKGQSKHPPNSQKFVESGHRLEAKKTSENKRQYLVQIKVFGLQAKT
jgi:hypothetical protein